jgi:integrase
VQTGSVVRHGRGWRGYWVEDGKRRATRTYERKGEARAALNSELDRLRLGDAYRPPITLDELCGRFLDQYIAASVTIKYARVRLQRARAALGGAQARDISPETLNRLLRAQPVGQNFKHDQVRTLRAVYRFGIRAKLVDANPAREVRVSRPVRGERIIPFESWAEVELVAEECGRWGPLVVFMADSGARPAEALAVEHRHVDGSVVELPGTKTEQAWRTVHLTSRGVDSIASIPRALATRRVFHVDGRPISWTYFAREVWRPALGAAGLPYRAPYNLRHTFAYWSLRAGVPIATVAREMGHSDVNRTFAVYGGWCREMGSDAAELRETWAACTNGAPNTAEDGS